MLLLLSHRHLFCSSIQNSLIFGTSLPGLSWNIDHSVCIVFLFVLLIVLQLFIGQFPDKLLPECQTILEIDVARGDDKGGNGKNWNS